MDEKEIRAMMSMEDVLTKILEISGNVTDEGGCGSQNSCEPSLNVMAKIVTVAWR